MPKGHKISEEIKNQIISLYKENTSTEIASVLNISIGSVIGVLKQNGIIPKNRKLDYLNDDEIRRLYENGLSTYQIAKKFDTNAVTIKRRLHKNGVKLRSVKSILKQRKGENNPTFKGYKKIQGQQWSAIKGAAKRRGLDFTITKEEAWKKYEDQNRKCALSGVNITMPDDNFSYKIGDFSASLDRIDSSIGYTLSNIQWVHKTINIMKSSMTDKKFIEWCEIVYRNNK